VTLHYEPFPGGDKSALVFGLEWRTYDPFLSTSTERSRYAREVGATHYVEYKAGKYESGANILVGGFCDPGSKTKTLFSGAARVAQHPSVSGCPAALVLLRDGSTVLLVHTIRGAVVADEVLDPDEARERRREIVDRASRDGQQLVMIGDEPDLDHCAAPFPIADLLDNKAAGKVEKLPRELGAAPKYIVLAVVIVGLLYGAVAAYEAHEQALADASDQQGTPQLLYARALDKLFGSPLPLVAPVAAALQPQIRSFSSNRKGWQFDRMHCPGSGACTVTWTRMGGSFADFIAAAPKDWAPFTFDPNGTALTSTLHVADSAPSLTSGIAWPTRKQAHGRMQQASFALQAVRAFNRSVQWPDYETLKAQVLSTEQDMSFDVTRIEPPPGNEALKPYKVTMQPPQPVFRTSVAVATKLGKTLSSGTWDASGSLWQLSLLQRLPRNFVLNSLDVTLEPTGVTFKANGTYYAFS
jgi:hypothetical protein